ncbi:hypothetical protein [Yoonia sp. 208BN28-4]|uniref:hypothetical protein n=1 Tax=Yoonia sp. 208BN28-4 TaxID=3126505 RepID=UPI0030B0661A
MTDAEFLADFFGKGPARPVAAVAVPVAVPAARAVDRNAGAVYQRETLRAFVDAEKALDPDRPDWPEAWFSGDELGTDAQACRAMWAAALIHMLRDLVVDKHSTPRIDLRSGWFGSRDFHQCCALAGQDGQAVASRIRAGADDPAFVQQLLRTAKEDKAA